MSGVPLKEPIDELANAIVLQAVEDYAKAYMGYQTTNMTAKGMIRDCEKFFKSDYYKLLTDLDSEVLMRETKKREIDIILDFISVFKQSKSHVKLVYKELGKRGKDQFIRIPPRFMKKFMVAINELEQELIQEKEEIK